MVLQIMLVTSGVHGAHLGEEEIKLTKEHYKWTFEEDFYVPKKYMIISKNCC